MCKAPGNTKAAGAACAGIGRKTSSGQSSVGRGRIDEKEDPGSLPSAGNPVPLLSPVTEEKGFFPKKKRFRPELRLLKRVHCNTFACAVWRISPNALWDEGGKRGEGLRSVRPQGRRRALLSFLPDQTFSSGKEKK